jgi:hypothetical protein
MEAGKRQTMATIVLEGERLLNLARASGSHVERITRLADVRDADPAPDGTWAVAVRNRHGLSELVRVDLDVAVR